MELECYAEATGFDVTVDSCVIAPPKGSVEISEIHRDQVVLTNNEKQVPIEFSWSSVDSDGGFSKIMPNIGRLEPGESISLDVTTAAYRPGLFEAVLYCTIAHLKEPVRVLTRLHVQEPKVVALEPSVDFGLLRTEGIKDVTITLHNTSMNLNAQYVLKPKIPEGLEISGQLQGKLLANEQRVVVVQLTGLTENLNYAGYIEVYSSRSNEQVNESSSPQLDSPNRLSSVIPIRGQISMPKLIPEKSIIEITEAFAPNIIKKVPVLLKNNGLLPVACEFNSFAVDHQENEEVILTELSCNGGNFELLVLQPGETHEMVVFVAWEKPTAMHQINLLFNVFAVDAIMDGNQRPGNTSAPHASVQPMLIALRAEPKNIDIQVKQKELCFDDVSIGQMESRVIEFENTCSVDGVVYASPVRFENNTEIDFLLSEESVNVPAFGKASLKFSICAKLFGDYEQVLELHVGVQVVRIVVKIKVIGCPLTLPMFAAGTPHVLRFSKMNTGSNKKTRLMKVFNPTNVPMAITWRAYWAKDIFDIPKVEIYGHSAFVDMGKPDDEVNLRILEMPGRRIEPEGLFSITPASQEVPPNTDVKFMIHCDPRLADKSIDADVQFIGYVTLLNEKDKTGTEHVFREDEFVADTLRLSCLANIVHIDKRKASLAKPLSLRVDAWALINESVNSALLEAINVTEFSQNYKVVQDEEAVFTGRVMNLNIYFGKIFFSKNFNYFQRIPIFFPLRHTTTRGRFPRYFY